ncbi:retrotransposon protein, putative, ty1-copia subclass [Tanacetum coccineum]
MVRSMMNLTTLPLSFWDYALETGTCILNMVPTKKVDKTPYELWYEKVPNLSYLKIWRCEETMGYYFYFLPENKIVVARYAEFLEKNLLSQEISRRAKELEEIQDEDTSPSKNTSDIPMEVKGFELPQEEVVHIRSYGAWLDIPPNCKTVGSKWFFKKKTDMDDIVHTYKAHLVAKGYTQTYEVDYEETFSPVANIRAIRILIAIAAFYGNLEIWHRMSNCLLKWMDTSNAVHILVQERLDLNKIQGATTPEDVKRMQNVPYASTVGSIMHVQKLGKRAYELMPVVHYDRTYFNNIQNQSNVCAAEHPQAPRCLQLI